MTPEHTFLQRDGKTVASIQSTATGDDAWIPHAWVDAIDRTIETAMALGVAVTWVSSIRFPSTGAWAASLILAERFSRCADRFQHE